MPEKEKEKPATRTIDLSTLRLQFGEHPGCGDCPVSLTCMADSLPKIFFFAKYTPRICKDRSVTLPCIEDGKTEVFALTSTNS